ncbi:uncharacterized protein LOC126734423 isoform X2 [Anthonomus grandis grandis]|uniref:uncharacterized protein LOC126734423 isoform X2 n=1 Tax=Anthonomus grandis grandis TaxID=2921223 RepID=UPI002165CC51|nr:uncharacterized protein LOC126734423 isoform X2 [Anthonomus grandis grandis]
MKIILMILLSTYLSIVRSDYPRFKRKGMVQNGPPARLPPPPTHQFGKKWGKPLQKPMPHFIHSKPRPMFQQQQPMRGNRPVPNKPQIIPGFNGYMQNQMVSGPKYPQFSLAAQKPPQLPPKEFYKKPPSNKLHQAQQFVQFPIENQVPSKVIHKQEKPMFHSSPSIPAAIEHDYHVQTNNIPMTVNTIKQVGEKGPIHTIPAPNLTPADKPSNLEYRKPHYQHQQEVRFQPENHHYQVSEATDQAPQPAHRDQINAQTHYNNQNTAQAYQNLQTTYFAQNNLGVTMQETGNHGINIGFVHQSPLEQRGEDMVFSNSQNYQVVNAHFSTGQPNSQNLHTQAIQSSYEQQQPQGLNQFVKSDNAYVNQYQEKHDDNNKNVEPEYHSFNYDEQAHQAQAKLGLVTAGYSLGSVEKTGNGQGINSRSSSVDPLTQSQIIQSYFDTRSENNVEPDAKPSGSGSEKEEPFYSSLPNKEAADRLAKLQAAGKVNSSLMKIRAEEKHNDMDTIYVPEEGNLDGKEDVGSKEQSGEYEDYSQEEETSQSDEDISGFGQKTKY